MTIETKYNVGDKVWLITHNTICDLTITSIMVTSCRSFNSIKYGFGPTEKTGMFDFVEENLVFPTKEELLASL